MDALHFRNIIEQSSTPLSNADNSACRTNIDYVVPNHSGATVTNKNRSNFRLAFKLPNLKVGDSVVVHHKSYGTKLFKVLSLWNPNDRNGCSFEVDTPFVEMGQKDANGLTIDRSEGWASNCPEDIQGFGSGTLFSGSGTSSSGSAKKYIIIVVIILVIGIAFFMIRKRMKAKTINK